MKRVLGLNDLLISFWFFLVLGEGLGLLDLVVAAVPSTLIVQGVKQ